VILILALILVPLAAGLMLLCLPDLPRKILVSLVTLAVCCGTVYLATLPAPVDLSGLRLNPYWINLVMQFVEIGMSIYIIYVGVRAKRPLIVALALAQACLMVWFEITQGEHLEVAQNLFVDKLAVIMALINGLVGGSICLYALGYMREYHQVAHRDVRPHLRQQPSVAVPLLGNHHALLVSADRLHANR
jgi:ech hydrogenase subunit A